MWDPKCSAVEAVARAQARQKASDGQYILGTGDYLGQGSDLPWTFGGEYNKPGSDCAGFAICWAWKLKRHRPPFNRGPWSSVEDDINCNSALEDAQHKQELFTLVTGAPRPGDLLLYPTIRIRKLFSTLTFVGHVGLVESVGANYTAGRWDTLSILQCHGPNGFKPGVVRTDGSIWLHHDWNWPKDEHRSHLVRPRERL